MCIVTLSAGDHPLSAVVPPWLRGYRRAWLRADLLAGLTLTVLLVPQAMAYANLAGLPPVTGLAAAVTAITAYAILGSSSHLSVGPFAVVSLLTAAAVAPLAGGDTSRAVALAGLLAVLTGAALVLLVLLRASRLLELLSTPVIVGYTAAAGVIIALTQVGDLTGATLARADRAPALAQGAVTAIGTAHAPTTVLGLGALLALMLLRRYAPRLPGTLLVVATATALVAVAGGAGIAVVGPVPAGLPRPALAGITLDDVRALLPAAATIAAVTAAGNASIATAVAARSRERLSLPRELAAAGGANLAAGALGGFPVAASFTRTVVVEQAGGRTQLANLVGAAGVLATMLVLTPVLAALPRTILAAIVLAAVVGLVDLATARRIWRIDRLDGLVLAATFAATLGLGVELGLLLGVVGNLGVHVARGMRPALVELGRVPGTRLYRDVDRYPTVRAPDGVLLRLDGPLDHLSAAAVTERLRRLAVERPELAWLVLDAGGVTGIDATGAEALRTIQQDLADAAVELHLTTLHGAQRDTLARAELWEQLVVGTCHPDIPTALHAVGVADDAPIRTPASDEQPPAELR